MQNNTRVEFANTLRGFAALSVLISHYFGAYWLRHQEISHIANVPPLLTESVAVPNYIAWLYPVPNFNWGPFGVALFFLISGFVIPFSFARMSAWAFAINRLLRIYPVYIAGLCVTLAGFYIGGRHYDSTWLLKTNQVLLHLPGIRDIAGYPSFDGIIWTLEVEMKFYVLCALAAPFFRRRSLLVFLIPIAIFAAAMSLRPSANWMSWLSTDESLLSRLAMGFIIAAHYLIFMFVGVAFHYAYVRRVDFGRAAMLMIVCFTLFCTLWVSGPFGEYVGATWNYAAAVMVFAFAYAFPYLFEGFWVFAFLARISYPLYVSHAIAGYVALRILLGYGVPASVALLIVSLSAIVVAWLIHRLIEAPVGRFSNRLRGGIDPARAALPAA